MLSFFVISNDWFLKNFAYKANNTSIFETKWPSLTSAALLPSLLHFSSFFSKNLFAKMKYIWKKCLLFRCCHAVVTMQILNLTNQCSFWCITIRYIMRSVRMTTHRTTHGNPRPRSLMNFIDFANAFLSPGVNSRAALVPSPRAYAQSRSPSLRSSGRNVRLLDNPLPEARNPG
jgi:hypothetical protein